VGLAIFKRPVFAGLFSFPARPEAQGLLGYRTMKTAEKRLFALFFAVKPKNRLVD